MVFLTLLNMRSTWDEGPKGLLKSLIPRLYHRPIEWEPLWVHPDIEASHVIPLCSQDWELVVVQRDSLAAWQRLTARENVRRLHSGEGCGLEEGSTQWEPKNEDRFQRHWITLVVTSHLVGCEGEGERHRADSCCTWWCQNLDRVVAKSLRVWRGIPAQLVY